MHGCDRGFDGGVDVASVAVWMSSGVVNRPRLNRTDSKAVCRDRPIAVSTAEGSIDPTLQVLPVDTVMPFPHKT